MGEPSSIEATLAEFSALREEIGYRSRFQQLLINLNLLVPGTIAAVVARDDAQRDLLLLVPLISAALGLFFADHATTIQLIGRYIRQKLSVDQSGNRILDWEGWSETEVKKLPLFRRYELPLSVVFLLPPTVALLAWPNLPDSASHSLAPVVWWFGLGGTAFMGFVLLRTNLKSDEDETRTS